MSRIRHQFGLENLYITLLLITTNRTLAILRKNDYAEREIEMSLNLRKCSRRTFTWARTSEVSAETARFKKATTETTQIKRFQSVGTQSSG